MSVISSKRFGKNQKKYFKKAGKGGRVIVQYGKGKACALVPVSESDGYFNAKMLKKIKKSMGQIAKGKAKLVNGPGEIRKLLGLKGKKHPKN